MNLKEALDLVHQAQRAMAAGNYVAAKNITNQILQQARIDGDTTLYKILYQSIIECRRQHVLNTPRILKRIDPIQAQRRKLS